MISIKRSIFKAKIIYLKNKAYIWTRKILILNDDLIKFSSKKINKVFLLSKFDKANKIYNFEKPFLVDSTWVRFDKYNSDFKTYSYLLLFWIFMHSCSLFKKFLVYSVLNCPINKLETKTHFSFYANKTWSKSMSVFTWCCKGFLRLEIFWRKHLERWFRVFSPPSRSGRMCPASKSWLGQSKSNISVDLNKNID